MLKRVGAVKYTMDADVPDFLKRVAVIELSEGDPIPVAMPRYDLTYYSTPGEIPSGVLAVAAHPFVITDVIPAWLKKVCAVVVSLLPILITDGKSLKFNDKTNSMHVIIGGFW